MVSRLPDCDPHRLQLLLEGQLPDDTEVTLAAHLESCTSCRARLESLAAEANWWSDAKQLLSDDDPDRPVPELHFLEPSEDPEKLGRLGPYEISHVIGCGGMGVVLKGFDATLNRYVAVKVLAPQLASSAAARRRFAREARAAAAVNHEHVVAIHAVDNADGLPYLVMPLVAGQSLKQRIDDTGPLEVIEILRIGMQAAAGLAAAHDQGLVHRDVKPANILLENGVERVLITDFGLARAIDDASVTQSGVLAGTPQYMAPEQAEGRSIDHRADLFSLGSVMYAMCTGHSPFRAEGTMAVLRRICQDSPRPVRDVNPEIPVWLVEIIAKLHERDPQQRFQTADDVADLLGRHLAHLQHPSSAPMPERIRVPDAGHRRIWLTATAVLLVLIGGLVVTETTGVTRLTVAVSSLFQQPEPEPPRIPPIAVIPPVPVEALQPELADAEIEFAYLHPDEAAESIRQQLCSIEADWREDESRQPPPDVLPSIGVRLSELEDQVQETRWDRLSDPLLAIRARLDALQREGLDRPSASGSSVDESLSNLGARLDALEEELDTPWP